jgi:hypothetical protein
VTSKNVVIDGIMFNVSTSQKVVTRQIGLFTRKDRKTLDKKERSDHYERATDKHHKLFNLISFSITKEDKLDNIYNLEMPIEHMRSYHADYMMDNVYKIISWGVDPTTDELNIN